MDKVQLQTLHLGLLAPVLLIFLASPATSCTVQEEASLLQFMAQLTPDSGSMLSAGSWQNGTSCCKWEGVACDSNGTVTELSLPSMGLEGNISASLANLTSLRRLDLSRNSLSGGLPPQLMSSGSIVVLDVSSNRLSGELQDDLRQPLLHHPIPLQVLNISSNFFYGSFLSTAWEEMRDLAEINASRNSFSGVIPSSFCVSSLSSFAVLDLSYNLFSGGIPVALGECSALRVLRVGNNDIGGTVPDELFSATSLEHLSFPKSGLEGELNGALLAKLEGLAILDLESNAFVGEIPDSIGQLNRLEELHLGYNNMSGELPSALCNSTSLRIINLRRNNFRGGISKVDFSGLPNLQILDLELNSFTGEIPESIYSCSKLTTLQLSSNRFHGQLSPSLANLTFMSSLSLANNAFKNISNALHALSYFENITTLLMGFNFRGEVMPDDVEITNGFQSLQVLSLGSCFLSGNFPLWLSKLARLEILDLSNNELTGPIPVWINSLSFLYFLDMSNNSLTGDLPPTVMEMPMLQYEDVAALSNPISVLPADEGALLEYGTTAFPAILNIGNNQITGTIPSEIGQLKSLIMLNLSFNSLSGSIPQELCNMTNLITIDLSNNHLTGSIPSALSNLRFLMTFDVSYNDFEGEVPSGYFETVVDGNPKLCGSLLDHDCASTEAPSSTPFAEQITGKIMFAIAFGAFFFVGVLYDQIVLSKFYGKPR